MTPWNVQQEVQLRVKNILGNLCIFVIILTVRVSGVLIERGGDYSSNLGENIT